MSELTGKWTVYMHVCPNGWVYIGSTGMKPERRWRKDGSGYYRKVRKVPFWDRIQEFGWDNIQHIIVGEYDTKEEAQLKERELTYLNRDHCYNERNVCDNSDALKRFKYTHKNLEDPIKCLK